MWTKLAACTLLAQLSLSCAESATSCAASPGDEAASVAEHLLDVTSALQLGHMAGSQKVVTDTEGAGRRGLGRWWRRRAMGGSRGRRGMRRRVAYRGASYSYGRRPQQCPFLPKHQPLKDPVIVRASDGPITLELTTIQVCDPTAEVTTWYTRAYALPGQAATIPGPTILVKPGDNLTITIINKLAYPNPDCNQTRPAQETGSHAYIDPSVNPHQITGFCYVNATNLHVHGMHVSPQPGGDNVFEHWPPGTTNSLSVMVPPNHATGQAGGGQHGAVIIEDPPGLLPKEIEALPTRVVVLTLVDVQNKSSITGSSSPIIEQQSLGDLWQDPEGDYVNRFLTTYMLTNGLWKPSWFAEDHEWTRFDFVYAAVEYNVVIKALPTNKDGAYLNYAPRKVPSIYMASGNRASFAMRCGCKKSFVGRCTGSLVSHRELYSPGGGAATMEEFEDGPPSTSRAGPFADVGQKTINQEFMFIIVKQRPYSFKPKCDDLPYFAVERPCYLVNLTGVDVAPQNNGTLNLPAPQGPTKPQWQIIYWSNVTTPSNYSGEPFEDDSPPLQNWTLGEVHELWFRHSYNRSLPAAYQIAGIKQHPIHLHVTQYQLVALQCHNGTWITHGSCEPDVYFQVGDWHDTLMFGGGQARVRFQLSTFNGPYILHCHILSHEDQGMMTWFNVSGPEGTVWPGAEEVQRCYRGYFGQS
ncbi:unnamed protein product [Symbiodinium natans]|uniref:Plastocyanin-like domain-containing protein n=1 Tax=Symbiodinium natans TaxID=878477 RepID=A0A812L9T3_9DINO|nr:unnamed protein product [Symbiodinium natans]